MNALVRDAIAGRVPRCVFEPQTVEDLADIVRETAAENLALAPIGSGTMLGLGNAPSRYDAAIHTRALKRVVDYEPADQVIVVEAGITLGELQTALAEKEQRLAVDPIGGNDMTIGGMLAADVYGPSALRFGTLKDLIVGIEFVRADGVIARAGGKVVKNVAGFDVSKLMVGSLGTLAIITKATFRLHPLPEASRTLAFAMPPAQVFPFVLALREAQLEPASLVASIDGACTVEVAFEGFGPGVDAQSEKCEQVAHASSCERVLPPNVPLSEASVASLVERRAVRCKATYRPSEFERVAAIVRSATIFPSLGVMFASLNPERGGASFDSALEGRDAQDGIRKLRSSVEALGGTLVIESMPDTWYGTLDAWGAPPPAFELMRSLKERFDPVGRLNPGRFVGGL